MKQLTRFFSDWKMELTNTNCLKDPTCAIFLKSMGIKDIKYEGHEGHKGPRPRRISEPSGDEEDLALLTPEERERRKSFEVKRKAHYNEFYAVKMARQLMDENDDEDEDENSSKPSGNCPMETENS